VNTAQFVFCNVPAGSYDVVASVVSGSNAYAPTLISGTPAGASLGNVQLFAGLGSNAQFSQITGTVSSSSFSSTSGTLPSQADAVVSAVEQVTVSSTPINFTVPGEQTSATDLVTTQANTGCPTNTDCSPFTLTVPGVNASSALYNPSGSVVSTNTSTPVQYTLDVQAFIPSSGAKRDCTVSDKTVPNLSVSAGASVPAGTIAFAGCQ
jgi:hypothetical protein